MRGSIRGRLRREGVRRASLRGLGGRTLALTLAAAIAACAGSPVPKGDTTRGPGEIGDVRVERDDDGTRVILVGPASPVFTAFKQPNPERVVVDIAARLGSDMAPLAIYDGLVEEVSLSSYETGRGESMVRAEVLLSGPAEFDVRPAEDGLLIDVRGARGFATGASDEAADSDWPGAGDDSFDAVPLDQDPWAMAEAAADDSMREEGTREATGEETAWDWDAAETTSGAQDAVAPAETAPAAEARRLTGIDARNVGAASLIHLQADGTIAAVESFALENPDRLVIDLPGIEAAAAHNRIDFGSPHAARIRVGQHADKTRVVIDAGTAPDAFAGRRIVPARAGLVVALGSDPQLDAEVAHALEFTPAMWAGARTPTGPSPKQASAPKTALDGPALGNQDPGLDGAAARPAQPPAQAPTMIYGVEFDAQDARDRIVLLGAEPVDYLVYEPDPETVVISIQDALVDPEAAVRIAPEPGGPVSLVTLFDQPDAGTPEARLVVKRAAGIKPQVSRRGALLLVDFERTGAVATTPPVLVPEPGGAGTTDAALAATDRAPAATGAHADTTQPAAAPAGQATSPAAIDPGAAPADPAALEPPAAISILAEGGLIDGKEYVGRRISLDFKEVDVADVLRLIAEVSDLNVIAGDEVRGKVTIRLVEVPWDQALDIILLTKGLGFMRIGNVLRIAPTDILAQEEEMRLQERRAKEKLEDLVVKLQPVNYADVGEVSKMVSQLLSARGTVNTDTRTNTLILKDIASVIDEATALVKAIDTQTPQVMIEAKIVEASLDFSREFGSVWNFGAQPLQDPFDPASVQRQDLGGKNLRFHNSEGSDFFGNNAEFLNPITAGPTGLFNLAGFLLDEKLNLELQLQAAEVNGEGKVISSPRVVTLDNSEATIQQGVSIPFQTFENGDAALEFVDAVLELKVKPHITADRSIIMDVAVSRNAPDDSVFTLTGSPAIAKNQVETETLVKDGQTLVLGGIYVVDGSERQSRVPYLHRIPILGAMFRSDEFSDSRKELLIFVTPRVVETADAGI